MPAHLINAVLRPSNLVGLLVLGVVVASGLFADNQNRLVAEQRLRADVTREAGLIRTRLEANINGNMQLVRGLIATLSTEPHMTQDRFATLASRLFKEHSQLRNIAGAPGLIVSLMYPLEGNEKAIGLDYNANAAQREPALRARDSGSLIIAGPVDLVQGGQGFIGRFPVFTDDTPGHREFWGIVSAVVDADRLYRESGLTDPTSSVEVAVVGRDGIGNAGDLFFGDEAITRDHPVISTVLLPAGHWIMSARPKGGWEAAMPNPWGFRLLIGIAGALVLLPLIIARSLMDERSLHIKEISAREHQLEILSRRLGLALDTSEVGVWEYNVTKDVLVWDDRMNELYGTPTDGQKRTYEHWKNALHPDDLERAEQEFATAVETSGRYLSEYRLRLPNGSVRTIRAIGACYEETDGTTRIVGVNWDVSADIAIREDLQRANALTEARNAALGAATARIEHNALHDALTGLPNRRYLDKVLEEQAAARHADGGSVALLHLDLDRFKEINDTLGHAAGDAMLVHVAKVLRRVVRSDDFVARIGGDEFVVVSNTRDSRRHLSALAQRIIDEMREPVPYEGHECRFGVSVGIAHQKGAKVDDKRLLIDADIALYRAKRRGRNRFEFFTEALQAEIVSTKLLADEILTGIERNEFVAWYQPQISARDGTVIGVEALARWRHPGRGILLPDSFMQIAEDLNVVATVDRMILEQTLEQLSIWNQMGIEIPHASVNVSARRLRDEDLIKDLHKLDIPLGWLSFELVESIYLDESDDIVAFNIDQIRDLGIDIEIDDFGTGYASIVSLLKLKPSRLKIDRQLVMPVLEAPAQRQLIASIVDIGHSLGIEVIAEGVETIAHAEMLTELGCDSLQGFAFARPLDPAALADFVRERQTKAA
jgi:diguanylate cyclase (GGDEF)-like protein